MGPVFHLGFTSTIRMQDLSSIGLEFSSKHLFTELSRYWKQRERPTSYRLMFACLCTWKGPFLGILLPRLLMTVFNFSQPYLLRVVVGSVSSQRASDDGGGIADTNRLRPYLVLAGLLVFSGSGITKATSTHMKNRLVVRTRGGLVATALDKSQRLEVDDAQRNAAISLMSADIGGIADALPYAVEIPFNFLESGLGVYLLWTFVQRAGLVVAFPLAFATLVSMIFGYFSAPAMKAWNTSIEDRVSHTSKIISQLSAIQALGLGRKFAQYIKHLRKVEVDMSKKYRTIRALAIATAAFCDLITPATVVTAALFWAGFGGRFTPSVVYPTLALVAHVQEPLAALFTSLPIARTMVACFERVEAYLCQAEHKDPRVMSSQSRGQSSVDATSLIQFDDAALARRGSEVPILRKVNVKIEPGSISTVFGPTGSGKTTFIDAILGEANLVDGDIFANDIAIAYCGQSVYLPNATIQECIVGYCEYEETWFDTVVRCCQLADDLRWLPGGKDYVVGPGGIALSGGQRIRVSIARAAFALARLVVLDDSLSSLDGTTARALLRDLCGSEGIFKRNGCAVVISSNMSACINYADQYLVLDGEGSLAVSTPKSNPNIRTQLDWLFDQENTASSSSSHPDDHAATGQLAALVQEESSDEEAARRQHGDLSLYNFWLGHVGRFRFVKWVIMVLLNTLIDAAPNVVLRYWISIAPEDKRFFIAYATLPFVCAGFAVLTLLTIFHSIGPRAAQGLHASLTESVFHASLGFLGATSSGSVMNMFSLDMNLLTKGIPAYTYNTLYFGMVGLTQMGIVLSGAFYLLVFIPFIGTFIYCLQRFYLRTSRQLRHLDLESQAPLVASVEQTSHGLIYIRGFGWQKQNMEHNFRALDESQKPVYLLYSAQVFLSLVLELMSAVLAMLLILFTIYLKKGTSENAIGLSFLSLIAIGPVWNSVVIQWTHLETAVGALDRVRGFVENTPQEKDGTAVLPENWPSTGQVEINMNTARYGPGPNQEERTPVLRDFSFSVAAGKKVGIIGRSGSGKTSFLLALLGFLTYDGSMKIDGVEIRDIPKDQLRSRIVTITQDNVVLDGTIRQNLLPFDTEWGEKRQGPLTEKEAIAAAQMDEFLRELLVRLRIWDPLEDNGKLDADVSKVGYSHGELQLLCIARAVVRRKMTGSNLVLVDEGTSSVDLWREKIVRQMMQQYFQGCTIIVIAHRDETIADANITITLANGKVIKRRGS